MVITILAATLDLCLRKTQVDKSPGYRGIIVFKKLHFQNFSIHTKTQSSVFKFLCFQERYRKAPFSVDNFSGLMWEEGLAGEIKLCFQIPPA